MNQEQVIKMTNRVSGLVGGDPYLLLIRRKTHTDIITNSDGDRRALVEWARSICDQMDTSKKIIVPMGGVAKS